jgi:DnaJ-class molecular chaperone
MTDDRNDDDRREHPIREFFRRRDCPACGGWGVVLASVAFAERQRLKDCPECGGTGRAPS